MPDVAFCIYLVSLTILFARFMLVLSSTNTFFPFYLCKRILWVFVCMYAHICGHAVGIGRDKKFSVFLNHSTLFLVQCFSLNQNEARVVAIEPWGPPCPYLTITGITGTCHCARLLYVCSERYTQASMPAQQAFYRLSHLCR